MHAREDIIGLDKFKACVATDHTTFRDMCFTYIDGIAEGNKYPRRGFWRVFGNKNSVVYRLQTGNLKLWELSFFDLKVLV
jgi:hypothetical protein